MKIRLQKFIRDVSGVSRRHSEKLIFGKKVLVNAKLAKIGDKVEPRIDNVYINGKLLTGQKKNVYVVLNKPAGYLSTREDSQGRLTIYNLLPARFKKLFPVGRLDLDTEGLIILTNDGSFSYNLTHPKFQIEKEYLVKINGKLEKRDIGKIERGINSTDLKTGPCKIKLKNEESGTTSLLITINEGQNREIKRIFSHFGFTVLYLKRLRINKYILSDLKSGEWKQVELDKIV